MGPLAELTKMSEHYEELTATVEAVNKWLAENRKDSKAVRIKATSALTNVGGRLATYFEACNIKDFAPHGTWTLPILFDDNGPMMMAHVEKVAGYLRQRFNRMSEWFEQNRKSNIADQTTLESALDNLRPALKDLLDQVEKKGEEEQK